MNHHRPADFAEAAATPSPLYRGSRTGGRGRVRPLERRDLEEIADIFLRVFRKIARPAQRRAAMPAVIAHLEELYLDCPWLDLDRGSLVHVDATDAVDGFLGSLHMPMAIDGTPITASAMGTFMVSEEARHSGAAVDLMRSHVANGLDLHFTDTANRISLGFRQAMRFELLPLHSLEWVLVLRPASLALQQASRRIPLLGKSPLLHLARPFDAPIRRMLRLGSMPADPVTVSEASREDFISSAIENVGSRRLRPDWTPEKLDWFIDRASRRTGNGPLHLRVATDVGGRVIGRWLVYAAPGSVASVLQVFPEPRCERELLRAMIRDAEVFGASAIRGTTEPAMMEALYTVPGVVFHHKGATALRSRHDEVMAAARAGDLSIGGLTGESWTRFVSDRF